MARIVINPQVFNDKRDALCVAFNEAFRVVMEMNGFEPVSEPTEKQRRFFSDTAYADDELQLRRTILARIATLDTSVSDPTDEQLEETMEMLEMVMEVGAPQNEWEQQAVRRLHDVVAKSLESTGANGSGTPQPEPPEEEGTAQADEGGGRTGEDEEEDELRRLSEGAAEARPEESPAAPGENPEPAPRPAATEAVQQPAEPQAVQSAERLVTRVDERGRHYDMRGRAITGRQADKMELAAMETREPAAPQPAQPAAQPGQPGEWQIGNWTAIGRFGRDGRWETPEERKDRP